MVSCRECTIAAYISLDEKLTQDTVFYKICKETLAQKSHVAMQALVHGDRQVDLPSFTVVSQAFLED